MLCVYSYACVSRKLISDLMACVKLPKVTKSTWVVALFREKSGSWRYCPLLPSSPILPHTQLSPPKKYFWLEPSTFGYKSQPLLLS